jgi:hypothetical protein
MKLISIILLLVLSVISFANLGQSSCKVGTGDCGPHGDCVAGDSTKNNSNRCFCDKGHWGGNKTSTCDPCALPIWVTTSNCNQGK